MTDIGQIFAFYAKDRFYLYKFDIVATAVHSKNKMHCTLFFISNAFLQLNFLMN